MSTVLSSTAASGMQAAQQQLRSTAHNLANAQTEGFHREQVVQQARPAPTGVGTRVTRAPQAGAALEADLVEQRVAQAAFGANLAVFRTGDQMLGALLDVRA